MNGLGPLAPIHNTIMQQPICILSSQIKYNLQRFGAKGPNISIKNAIYCIFNAPNGPLGPLAPTFLIINHNLWALRAHHLQLTTRILGPKGPTHDQHLQHYKLTISAPKGVSLLGPRYLGPSAPNATLHGIGPEGQCLPSEESEAFRAHNTCTHPSEKAEGFRATRITATSRLGLRPNRHALAMNTLLTQSRMGLWPILRWYGRAKQALPCLGKARPPWRPHVPCWGMALGPSPIV